MMEEISFLVKNFARSNGISFTGQINCFEYKRVVHFI